MLASSIVVCDELSRIAALLYSGSDGNTLQLVGLACNSLGSSDISMVLFLFFVLFSPRENRALKTTNGGFEAVTADTGCGYQ